jgi:hypothetical protein
MEKIDSRVSSIEVSDAEPPVADQFKLSDRHIAVKSLTTDCTKCTSPFQVLRRSPRGIEQPSIFTLAFGSERPALHIWHKDTFITIPW